MSASAASASWDDLARKAALRREEGSTQQELLQLLTFVLDGAPYALPVERVREIVRLRPVTPIPRMPPEVLGAVSLRGEIAQVVDLHRRLSLPERTESRSSRIVVVHGSDGRVAGVVVDAVTEVIRISEEEMRPAAAGDTTAVMALCPRGDEFVSLIDLDRVLEIDADD